MAFTPEEETALRALIAQDPKIISDLEAEAGLNGDEVFAVEDGSGTFATSVNDVAQFTQESMETVDVTATAAGTTTLTVDSGKSQVFTGTTTQTVKLPVVSTLYIGKRFQIANLSTGVVTVQSSGSNTLQAMAANSFLEAICIAITGTGTASWSWRYSELNKKSGDIVQKVHTQTGAVSSGSTVLPNDDTVPQNTEGDQLFSQSITPAKTTNKLLHILCLNVSANSIGTDVSGAIFQDSTAGALASRMITCANNYAHSLVLIYEMDAGTVSATTFKARVGGSGATTTINGINGSRKHGGVMISSYTIIEIQV